MAPSYNNGRRGPNVSQFIRNLNTTVAIDEGIPTLEEDWEDFANTHFYDVDLGKNTDYQAPPVKPDSGELPLPSTNTTAGTEDLTLDLGDMGFIAGGDFSFTDFTNSYHDPSVPSFHDGLGNLQPLQPNPTTHYPSAVPQQTQQNVYVQTPSRTPASSGSDALSSPDRPVQNFEEQSRLAAEEDKRRRNTAASARFRIKKKQREQALEKSAKEMSDKVTQLESRINLLETENRWLKNLVMEKNDGNEEIAAMFKEFDSKHKADKAAIGAKSSGNARGEK